MNVHYGCVHCEAGLAAFSVVNRDQSKIDAGLLPYDVVREDAARDGGEDRAVCFYLSDEVVERGG